jgi:hypothetical protein
MGEPPQTPLRLVQPGFPASAATNIETRPSIILALQNMLAGSGHSVTTQQQLHTFPLRSAGDILTFLPFVFCAVI